MNKKNKKLRKSKTLLSVLLLVTTLVSLFSCKDSNNKSWELIDKEVSDIMQYEYMSDRNLRFHYDKYIQDNLLCDSNSFLIDSLLSFKNFVYDIQVNLVSSIDTTSAIEKGGIRSWIRIYNLKQPLEKNTTHEILFAPENGSLIKSLHNKIEWLIGLFNSTDHPLIYKKYKEVFTLYEMSLADGTVIEWEDSIFGNLTQIEAIYFLNKYDRYFSEWIIDLNK